MNHIDFEQTDYSSLVNNYQLMGTVSVGPMATIRVMTESQVTIHVSLDLNVWNRKLEQLRSLGDAWNGYDSPAPSNASIVTAKAFLSTLGTDFEPSRLAPSVSGGIGITHKKGTRRVYVEFFNDGDVCVLFSDGETPPRSRRVKPSQVYFKRLTEEIREYLDA